MSQDILSISLDHQKIKDCVDSKVNRISINHQSQLGFYPIEVIEAYMSKFLKHHLLIIIQINLVQEIFHVVQWNYGFKA